MAVGTAGPWYTGAFLVLGAARVWPIVASLEQGSDFGRERAFRRKFLIAVLAGTLLAGLFSFRLACAGACFLLIDSCYYTLCHGRDRQRAIRQTLLAPIALMLMLSLLGNLNSNQKVKNAAYYDLWIAFDYKNTHFIERMLAPRPEVNARWDEAGNTLLHLATRRGQRKAAAMLLEKGADPTLANHEGRTALDIARERGDTELARVLLAPNAKISEIKSISLYSELEYQRNSGVDP